MVIPEHTVPEFPDMKSFADWVKEMSAEEGDVEIASTGRTAGINPDRLAPGPALQDGNVVHRTNRGDVMNLVRDRPGVNDGTDRVLFHTEAQGSMTFDPMER